MKRLVTTFACALAGLGFVAPAGAGAGGSEGPPRIDAQTGGATQRADLYSSSWNHRQGRRFCVSQESDGVPSDRTRMVAPGRRRVRLTFDRPLKPASVRIKTYSRKVGPGEYADGSRPRYELERVGGRDGRAAWRVVFSARLMPGEYLRGEFSLRYPDTDGCGADEGVGAFTFRAARPRD